MIRIDRTDRVNYRLRSHHHSRTPAERIIITFSMLIRRIIANVVDFQLDKPVVPSALHYSRGKRRENLGKKRQDVDDYGNEIGLRIIRKTDFVAQTLKFVARTRRFVEFTRVSRETIVILQPYSPPRNV